MDEQKQIIDLGEATALATLGFPLIKIEDSKDKKYKVFTFGFYHPNSSTVNADATIDAYYKRKLQVDAYSFYHAGRDIKNRIHEHSAKISY